jgi:hypothetical protein
MTATPGHFTGRWRHREKMLFLGAQKEGAPRNRRAEIRHGASQRSESTMTLFSEVSPIEKGEIFFTLRSRNRF